jgi:hypothetical protein
MFSNFAGPLVWASSKIGLQTKIASSHILQPARFRKRPTLAIGDCDAFAGFMAIVSNSKRTLT